MTKNGPFNTYTPEQIAEVLRNSNVQEYIVTEVLNTIQAQRQEAFEIGLGEVDKLMK